MVKNDNHPCGGGAGYQSGGEHHSEIGGQDSKIIILWDGIVSDFAMNTVCAAGTGSFLDRQAARLQDTHRGIRRPGPEVNDGGMVRPVRFCRVRYDT